ncbi:MAG: hypothetical protein IH949_12580 [Bacteroidetes bacterium]|nr:hypothetical protein [Bacteroidota bacterium]
MKSINRQVDNGQDVYMASMALALSYGLLFATPLTLVLIPSMYAIRNDCKRIGEYFTDRFTKK